MTADTSRRSCGALVTGDNGGLGLLGADTCRNTARPGDKFRCPAAHSVAVDEEHPHDQAPPVPAFA